MVCADQKIAACLGTDKILVFIQQVLLSGRVSLMAEKDDLLIRHGTEDIPEGNHVVSPVGIGFTDCIP